MARSIGASPDGSRSGNSVGKKTLPPPPPEVRVERSLDVCAPRFAAAVRLVIADMQALGMPVLVTETLRTAERQAFLFGFGREYDDGRGEVTRAPTHLTSWHGYGLAADLVHASRYWNATEAFWIQLGKCARARGLTWGGGWKVKDRPHVQWGRCRTSPSAKARALLAAGGLPAVWEAVGAT